LGNRRKIHNSYNIDRLILIKKQIEFLRQVKHELSNIVFSFNIEEEHLEILSKYINKIPKRIQNANVEIVLRKNVGMSYAAWVEYVYNKTKKYDYYIFNEDDYFFTEDYFDKQLLDIFENKNNCGFLAAISREASGWNQNRKHAGCSIGMASKESLEIVKDDLIKILDNNGKTYTEAESIQIDFTHCYIKKGLDIYDVRDKFRIPFSTTMENEKDVIVFFHYNQTDLVKPFIMLSDVYTFSVADLEEFKRYE
jgi:hypothetical protein